MPSLISNECWQQLEDALERANVHFAFPTDKNTDLPILGKHAVAPGLGGLTEFLNSVCRPDRAIVVDCLLGLQLIFFITGHLLSSGESTVTFALDKGISIRELWLAVRGLGGCPPCIPFYIEAKVDDDTLSVIHETSSACGNHVLMVGEDLYIGMSETGLFIGTGEEWESLMRKATLDDFAKAGRDCPIKFNSIGFEYYPTI